jgi:hypothetical protein
MRLERSILKAVLGAGCVLGLVWGVAWAQSSSTSAQKKASHSSGKSATHTTTSRSRSASSTSHKAKTRRVSASSSSHKTRHSRKSRSRRGQQHIDAERTREIQEALIREHYLSGQPSGKWDAATEGALRRLQDENGWQSKTVPDSRALIKLGLGPNQDHLLNPESAMTTAPEAARANPASEAQPAGSNPASDPNQQQQ